MTLLGPVFVDAPDLDDVHVATPSRPGALPRTHRYRPPSIPAPAALEGVTNSLDELLDATSAEVEPYADDLSEAFELLRNVADKIADDRAGRSAA